MAAKRQHILVTGSGLSARFGSRQAVSRRAQDLPQRCDKPRGPTWTAIQQVHVTRSSADEGAKKAVVSDDSTHDNNSALEMEIWVSCAPSAATQRRRAVMAASLHRAAMSAPTKPCAARASAVTWPSVSVCCRPASLTLHGAGVRRLGRGHGGSLKPR